MNEQTEPARLAARRHGMAERLLDKCRKRRSASVADVEQLTIAVTELAAVARQHCTTPAPYDTGRTDGLNEAADLLEQLITDGEDDPGEYLRKLRTAAADTNRTTT